MYSYIVICLGFISLVTLVSCDGGANFAGQGDRLPNSQYQQPVPRYPQQPNAEARRDYGRSVPQKPYYGNLQQEEAKETQPVKVLCSHSQKLTLEEDVSIPSGGANCDWRGRDGSRISGIKRYSDTIVLPEGAVMCDIDFTFNNQRFRYDDQVVFSLNDFALMVSYYSDRYFELVGDLRKWTEDIWGQPFSETRYSPWCMGKQEGKTTCTIPKSDRRAQVQLDVDEDILQEISEHIRDEGQLTFDLAVLGGNNRGSDCAHSGLDLSATVTYVLP